MDCVFCKISTKQIFSYQIYEDDKCFIILDISQTTKGHALVIAKKHIVDILNIDETLSAHIFKVATRFAKHLVSKLNANGCNILNNCRTAGDQSVFHFHVHIIPRYDENDGYQLRLKDNAPTTESLQQLQKLLT